MMRIKKWLWPLFVYTIDLAVQNAWLLYRKTPSYNENPVDLLVFRRDIVRVYLMRHSNPLSLGRPDKLPPISRRVPEEVWTDSRRRFAVDMDTQKRCAKCGKNTRQMCKQCTVRIHLHYLNAFNGFH
jgi:hypothetical protein